MNDSASGQVLEKPRPRRLSPYTWFRTCGHDVCIWGEPSDPAYCAYKPSEYECAHDECCTQNSPILRNGAWYYRCTIDGTVYFVQRNDLVKIGWTRDLSRRLKDLNKGSAALPGMTLSPVRLLLTFRGSRWRELEWHEIFAEQRVAGEWFRYEGWLAEFIGVYLARWPAPVRVP